MTTATIPCTLAKGFFDTELYVHVGTSSAVVDRGILTVMTEPNESREGSGCVTVYIVEDRGAETLVELPGELAFGSQRLWIDSSILQSQAAHV